MALEPAIAAIVGGSVAGGVVLVAILAFVIYLLCGKKRRKHQRENKKFQQLSPHTSPSHSQPSTLGHGPGDPRLPKVSSNGLWVGTPSIYAATPSPAYYYGRPAPKAHGHPVQPAVMQRATSESRLPQQVPGPAVYATGSNQRIYHSQQLTPLYEVMDPRSGNVYDVYEFGGSKTRLLHDGKSRDKSAHGHGHGHGHGNKRLERSQSDRVLPGEPSKRAHRSSKNVANGQRPHSGRPTSARSEMVQVHQPKQNKDKDKAGYENPAFRDHGTTEKIEEVEKVVSATDSMKILAKNKTDDQKTVVQATSSSSTTTVTSDTKSTTAPAPTSAVSVPATANFRDPPLIPLHYIHEGGDIYAVPLKEESNRRSTADNPILARMQDMVIERSGDRHEGGGSKVDPITDISETAEPLVISPVDGSPARGTAVIQNPIYQEVEETRQLRNPTSDLIMSANVRARNHAAASAAQSTSDLDPALGASSPSPAAVAAPAAGSASEAVVEAAESTSEPVSAKMSANGLASTSGAVDSGVDQSDGVDVTKAKLATRWSTDTEGATDDLSRAEKHITATAFEFLDTYLSDEEGADIHSPPKSPVLSDRGDLDY